MLGVRLASTRPFCYKFTVASCESVNLIGYINVAYLLIDNSCTRDCTRDPFSTEPATFKPDVT